MSGAVVLSVSELRALVTKAARGAGMAWGLAEEAGWAAEWLARRGWPAAEAATLWLQDRLEGRADPVTLGTAWADDPQGVCDAAPGLALPDGLAGAAYLLPFLHRAAQALGPLALVAADGGLVAQVSPGGEVRSGPAWAPLSRGWRLAQGTDDAPAPAPAAARPSLSPSVLDCLEVLALRTTVPPSAASRQDAGSGRDDND